MRQDDDVADDRGLRAPVERNRVPGRRGRHPAAAEQTRHRDGVSGLCAVSAHDDRRKYRLRTDGAAYRQGGDQPARQGAPEPRAARRRREPVSAGALRWPAAADRGCARSRVFTTGFADGRAAGCARSQAARGDADRDPADPTTTRYHYGLRHARSDRGDAHVRPNRRDERRHDRTDGQLRRRSTTGRARASSPTSSGRSICSTARWLAAMADLRSSK